MTPSGQTICLCMIVKDEAHVIRRCLDSVRPVIDRWLIVDTGSTDGTQDAIRGAMTDLPGALVERRWVDFAHNRNEALSLARSRSDYTLVIDADDEIVLPAGDAMPDLEADCFTFDIRYGDVSYRRKQLVRNVVPWRYKGVLHEFLHCVEPTVIGHLPILVRINHDGRRGRVPAETYASDAAILEKALATETDAELVARYTFYLGQSYRDAGAKEAALAAYLRRARLGGWEQEVYVSLLEAGRLMEDLGGAVDRILAIFEQAIALCPTRIEAAHAASRLCRVQGRFADGYAFAYAAAGIAARADGLFVQHWIHDYGLDDELAVNAYWAGHYRESLDAALRALESGKVPPDQQRRLIANARFAFDRLPSPGSD